MLEEKDTMVVSQSRTVSCLSWKYYYPGISEQRANQSITNPLTTYVRSWFPLLKPIRGCLSLRIRAKVLPTRFCGIFPNWPPLSSPYPFQFVSSLQLSGSVPVYSLFSSQDGFLTVSQVCQTCPCLGAFVYTCLKIHMTHFLTFLKFLLKYYLIIKAFFDHLK